MDAADDLVRAYGKKQAGEIIDEYAALDLYSVAFKGGKFNSKTINKI